MGGCSTEDVGPFGGFYHTKAGSESKIAREMLRFTIETVAGGREGRRCRTGGCGRYVGTMFALVSHSPHWQECSEVAERKAMRGILLGNATADC